MDNLELIAISNGCSSVGTLVSTCADSLKKSFITIKVSNFADTETNIIFKDYEKFKNKNILFIHQFSFKNECSINRQLMNFLFVVDTLKNSGAKKIVSFLPYMPYARQEGSLSGEGGGLLGALTNLFKCSQIDKVIACDLHEPSVISKLPIDFEEIKLDFFWADIISKNKFIDFEKRKKDIILASPDKGGIRRVKKIASILNLDFVSVLKKRIGFDQTVAKTLDGDVKDKFVILIDDIVDTAGTAINACNMLIEKGAKEVIGCLSHGVSSANSTENIEKSKFSKIFVTNTIILSEQDISKKVVEVSSDKFMCEKLFDLVKVEV